MPQGPKNGPKVTRSVEFEFERDLREFKVGLVLKLEFELGTEFELEQKLELELLRDVRRALEFASCEECTKSSKNLKIVLFHHSQLDFRKCLKAPKTVQK